MLCEGTGKFADGRVFMKDAVKSTVIRGGVRRLFIIILACALILSGCAVQTAPASEVTSTPATPTPEATPAVQTPALILKNPVEEFWDRFEQAGDPIFLRMNLESDEGLNLESLDKTLAVVQHMQRLQQLFIGLTELGQVGSDATGWSGMLVGGMEGTGSIQTTAGGYTFSCVFSDSSTLSGTLQNDVLQGEWQAEGRPLRSGEILFAQGRWFAQCLWEGTGNLMLLDGDTLYFAQGATVLPGVAELPEEWADWSCRDGLFTEYSADQTQIEEESD